MRRLHPGRWTLFLATGLIFPAVAIAGPEIFSIEPESGPAGTPVQIKGKGLTTTGRVVFAIGRAIRPARFKVVSDQEVRALAPECYRAGAAATLAVFTEHGAAIAMPATVQTIRSPVQGTNVAEPGESFYHVLDRGILTTSGGVAVIEKGGVVVHSSSAAMQFVKSGGTLLEFQNARGIVFYEQAAQLGPGVVKPNRPAPVTLVRLPDITACPGVGPFRFQAPLAPDLSSVPAGPPLIRGFSPPAAASGEIVTLTGNGFARTTEVRLLASTGGSRAAGFRIISDRELRVEVPDEEVATHTAQLLAVATTEGLAVTVPRHQTIRPGILPPFRDNRALFRAALAWISSGDIVNSANSQSIFISPGGLVTQAAANSSYFIQHDGRLGDAGGNPSAVFFEPGAIIPDRLKRAPVGQSVRTIVPSPVDGTFVLLRTPAVRR
jgi:IPT/TIG domain